MELHDTAGQEELKEIRTIGYSGAKVILLCFAINDLTTFENVKQVWVPELSEHVPDAKLLLIGTKGDLRKEATRKSVKQKSARGKVVSFIFVHTIQWIEYCYESLDGETFRIHNNHVSSRLLDYVRMSWEYVIWKLYLEKL